MDFLIVIVAAAALVWTSWFLLRGSLVAGCLAAIVAGACGGYQLWHAEVGPAPLSADRAMVALLAVAYLVHRRWGLTNPKPMGRADYVLLALLGALTVSTFTHDWHDHNSQPVAQLALYWFMPATVYWIVRQSTLDSRTLRWTLGTLAIFGVYLTGTALAEATGQWWATFPSYIASPATEYFGRARGPFLNPAEMGIYLTACLAAALTFWPRFGRGGQLILLVFTLLSLVGIYATLTRSTWMGGALGLAILVGCSVPRAWRKLLVGAGAAAGLVMLAASWDSVWNLKRDVKLDASASVESAQLRPILAKVAWDMFRDRPLWGCGLGQYDREKLPYLADRSSELPLEKVRPYVQHNAFLALLTETGLIGMGLMVLLLALWIQGAWQLWRDDDAPLTIRQIGLFFLALVGVYLPNAMFQNTNIIDGVNLLLFFTAGIVSGLVASEKRPIANEREVVASRGRSEERVLALTN